MKKLIVLACAALVLSGCQERIEERAERDAHDITAKRCPVRMSEDIILERVDFDKTTRTWKQSHLIDIDSTLVLPFAETKAALLQELKNTPSYKAYMDAGFVFEYVYCRLSAPQDTVIDMVLQPDDYR